MDYKILLETSDEGKPIYIYEDSYGKIPLNSLYSPRKEAERFIRKVETTQKKLLIIIGAGNGEVIKTILDKRFENSQAAIYFIEPLQNIKIDKELSKRISDNNKVSLFYLENLNSPRLSKVFSSFSGVPTEILIHPNYNKINQSYIKETLALINESLITKQIMANTETKFAIDWLVEPLLNFKNIIQSNNLVNLKGKFSGERAILIAAGPSLKENVPFLKERQTDSYLFSVGSALKFLLSNDISPDYVLSLDTSETNYEAHFSGTEFEGSLIYETMSNSKIQNTHKGNLIVSRSLDDFITNKYYPELIAFRYSSPSVAVYTLQVIAYLGFKEIYLVGQDLALVGGRYYAKGVTEHTGSQGLQDELFVEDNSGGKVGTTRPLKIFLDSFESLIEFLSEDIVIYNISAKGAKIKGTHFIETRDIKSWKRNEVCIEERKVSGRLMPDEAIDSFINDLKKLKNDVEKAKSKLETLILVNAMNKNDMVKVVKEFRKVSKNSILEEVIMSRMTFAFDQVINKFKYLEEKDAYKSDDLLAMCRDLMDFYSLIYSLVEKVLTDQRISGN
ncbi:motility associated factor glycosyltransferase family protein [Domibacillus indicus]|uniref:motility associated factor glycosyltransferase family protein n=1 Tax=Domibacillus indicus TaxID=1437523 RepID=UPI0006180405|nr:6-hydroxymethylpterin diphosphokinase MptE-like protein [Domibacillus indicus]